MKTFKRVVVGTILLILALFFSYVLPQHDVVKVTSTEIMRQDFSGFNRFFYAQSDTGGATAANRDLRLVNSKRQETFLFGFIKRDSTEVMVYRNEDTGWGWPPYFKFDSSDVQAEAEDLAKRPEGENWAVMTHYGWRNQMISIYPNVTNIRPIDGPDVTIIPWFNIIFFFLLAIVIGFIRARWITFRRDRIDPAIDNMGEAWDNVDAGADRMGSRVKNWIFRSKSDG